MADYFDNRDGWYDKYIKNTGPVGYITANNAPHWQCIKCDYNHRDIGTIRQHVYKNHASPIRKDTVGGLYGIDNDSMGG